MTYPETENALRAPTLAFRQLKDALEASDIEGARRCFSLVCQYAPPATGSPDAISAAFEEVGKVLTEGDLGKAQVAFEVMQSLIVASVATQPEQKDATRSRENAPRKVNIVG
jgi:hypothetical protein